MINQEFEELLVLLGKHISNAPRFYLDLQEPNLRCIFAIVYVIVLLFTCIISREFFVNKEHFAFLYYCLRYGSGVEHISSDMFKDVPSGDAVLLKVS